jgi:hypothetical protein
MRPDDGLPQNTELTQRRRIQDLLRREQQRLETLEAGAAAHGELSRLQAEQDAAWEAFRDADGELAPPYEWPEDFAPVPPLP